MDVCVCVCVTVSTVVLSGCVSRTISISKDGSASLAVSYDVILSRLLLETQALFVADISIIIKFLYDHPTSTVYRITY